MLAPTRKAPSMIITAPGAMSRTLTAAESERTAQRSHRGYRPASHMSRSAPGDLPRALASGGPGRLAVPSSAAHLGGDTLWA
jgi:hypothetical protein